MVLGFTIPASVPLKDRTDNYRINSTPGSKFIYYSFHYLEDLKQLEIPIYWAQFDFLY